MKINLGNLPKSAIVVREVGEKKEKKEFLVINITDTRLFKGKDGNVYLDAVAIPYKEKKYDDDYFIAESVSQDERKAGTQGEIIGNARVLGGGGGSDKATNDQGTADEFVPSDTENDDLPF